MTVRVNMDVYTGDENYELVMWIENDADCEGCVNLNLEEAKEVVEELKKKIEILESLK